MCPLLKGGAYSYQELKVLGCETTHPEAPTFLQFSAEGANLQDLYGNAGESLGMEKAQKGGTNLVLTRPKSMK